jgi:carboxypeptidase family protein
LEVITRLNLMPRRSPVPFLLTTLFVGILSLAPGAASQTNSDHFDLHGKVINSVTGEPISGALVQLSYQQVQFTQSDGSFAFTNLPRGPFALQTKKPGFFNDVELGRGNPWMSPETAMQGDVIVKLTPEGIIFGQLKNENGEPVEGAPVKLQRWQTANGRRQLEFVGQTTTSDEGTFRFAELTPGNYFLSFAPPDRGIRIANELRRKKQDDQGYGSQFYPGTPDISAATALPVRPGSQLHIIQTISRQRLFEIAGVVRGAGPQSRFDLSLVDWLGELIPLNVHLNPNTGEFQITGIPAGSYLLSATFFPPRNDPPASNPAPLTARLPVEVNTDLSGLVLSLAPAIQAVVQLLDEIQPDATTNNFHQVTLSMISQDFSRNGPSITVPQSPDAPSMPSRFENLPPGTYSVQAFPNGSGYVAALRCGSVDLLRDDLTIVPGSPPPPIEVTLRGDSAQLTAALQDTSKSGTFVVYSPEYPRRSVLMPAAHGATSASIPNLPPGTYQVFALNDASELEFHSPAAVEQYLKRATTVTLQSGDNANIRVELQQSQEPQP